MEIFKQLQRYILGLDLFDREPPIATSARCLTNHKGEPLLNANRCSTPAEVLAALGGQATVDFAGSKTIYVSKGANATDTRTGLSAYDANRPFATLTAAKDAAVSGDTISVGPGDYNERNLLKNGVNWCFLPGARVVFSQEYTEDQATTAIWDDGGAMVVSVIRGGDFIVDVTDGALGVLTGTWAGVRLTNASSNVRFEGIGDISVQANGDNLDAPRSVIQSEGALYIAGAGNLDQGIENSGGSQHVEALSVLSAINISGTQNIATESVGVISCSDGTQRVDTKTTTGIITCGGGNQTVRADSHSALQVNATNGTQSIDFKETAASFTVNRGAFQFVRITHFTGTLNTSATGTGTSTLRANIDSWINNGLPSLGGVVDVVIACPRLVSTTAPAFQITATSGKITFLHCDVLVSATSTSYPNWSAVRFGAASTCVIVFEGGRFAVSDTNDPVIDYHSSSTGNSVILSGVTLVAGSSASNSINAAAAETLKVYSAVANKAVDGDITQQVGTVTVDANVT